MQIDNIYMTFNQFLHKQFIVKQQNASILYKYSTVVKLGSIKAQF